MNPLLLQTVHTLWLTVMESSSDSNSLWLLALGPAGAVGVYWGLYRYYRNTDKSHSFETETDIQAQPVTGDEHKVGNVRGTQRKRINGDNQTDHRSRVHRLN